MKHVLLIDDDEDDRDFFRLAFEGLGQKIQCEALENGFDAIDYLKRADRLPDVVFLDLNMPVMNGREFLRQIKKEDALKHIPVIVLSTSGDPATIKETTQLGAADFITKPNKLSLLEERLKAIFTRSNFFNTN